MFIKFLLILVIYPTCYEMMLQDYTLEGEFGMATDDFTETGRVIERTTFGKDHSYVYCIFFF